MPNSENFYSQTVTVITIFFSTIMALGLQKILEEPLGKQKWWCFFVALTLFVRFLAGSANHLWFEHVTATATKEKKNGLLWHFGWLTLFAYFGLRICYSDSLEKFLIWNGVFGLLAVAAPFFDTWREHKLKRKGNELFFKWLGINGAFLAAVGLVYLWYWAGGKGAKPYELTLMIASLGVCCAVLLLADLHIQLKYLHVKYQPADYPAKEER
jgi:hypothetical protein